MLVLATGNETQPNPDVLAGTAVLFPAAQRGFLAVGAVDANNAITDYSNRCGIAAAYCLVAPGDVTGTVATGTGTNGGNVKFGQGTSYATPSVAGAAALVKQAFPWFTNYDLQQAILTTATPLGTRTAGSVTPDTTFGWGLLNVGAAVNGYGGFIAMTTLDTAGSSSTFSNNIYGPGGLTKAGAGALTLSGANTYAGATVVNGGSLVVSGSIVSPSVTVASGAAFGGSGVVGSAASPSAVTINGTLGLGSPSTLTVNGSLSFGASGTYLVTIKGATADQVNVSGAASLAGTLSLAPDGQGGYKFNSAYNLLTAQSVTGTFNKNVVTSFGPGVLDTVSYTGTAVNLTLTTAQLAQVVATPAVTPSRAPAANVAAAAAALDNAAKAGANVSPLFPVYNSQAGQLDANLDALTGEVHASANALAVQIGDEFLDKMLSPILAGRASGDAAVLGYAPTLDSADAVVATGKALAAQPAFGYNLWAAALGSSGRLGANAAAGSSGVTLRDGEIAGGVDFHLGSKVLFGLAASVGAAGSTVDNGLGSARADVFQIGGYGVGRFGELRLSDAAAFSMLNLSTSRSAAALGTTLTANYGVYAFSNRFEAAYAVAHVAGITVSPFGSMFLSSVNSPAFTETASGGGAGALAVNARSGLNAMSDLGLELASEFRLGGVLYSGYYQIGWERVWRQGNTFTASLAGTPGSSFTTVGAGLPRDSFKMSSVTDIHMTDNMTLTTRFDTQLAGSSRIYGATAGLKIAF